jgi:AbrB family looped-hinge helix DNA binding protein
MKTTVSVKGQITIPKPLRLHLGIKPRQVLNVREERGRLILAKSDARDPVDAVFGILDLGRPTDQLLASLRGAKDPE